MKRHTETKKTGGIEAVKSPRSTIETEELEDQERDTEADSHQGGNTHAERRNGMAKADATK